MPAGFDPYHTWLAIPPEKQPPNHYDLLGVPLFEDNPSTIEHAADQRMAHLRTLQPGKRGKVADKLLSEVAAARVCLLNPEKKAAYDQELRKTLYVPRKVRPARRKHTGETTTQSMPFNQLGEYRLLEKLGEGGMGTVYKALHIKLGRQVALKVLPKQRVDDEKAIARFEREMKAVGQLDHTNVVRAHDAREIGGTCFLVMELVHGMDLARFVRQYGPLQVADACEVIRQAALGLHCAHEHNLVHRDVKPSNLMLTHDGEVKLLDLGLARFHAGQSATEEMTSTGQALGTLDYMAPEQISSTHTVDIRADIYSLGCTLYKLLTGQPPFSGPRYQTSYEKMRGHLQDPIPPVRQFRDDVPVELVAVLNRMLAKEPGLRFGTPAEVADAVGPLAGESELSTLLARAGHKPPPVVKGSPAVHGTRGSPSSSLTRFLQGLRVKPPPPPPGAEQARRTNLGIVAGAAAVGVFLLVLLIVWAVTRDHRKEAAAPAPPQSYLVLLWPETEREGATVEIDDEVVDFSRKDILANKDQVKVPIKEAGFHTLRIKWPAGTFSKGSMIVVGKEFVVEVPPHPPHGNLILEWPRNQRAGATLKIDDEHRKLSWPIVASETQVKVPLVPGEHQVYIEHPALGTFGPKPHTIEDREDTLVELIWERPAARPPSVKPLIPTKEQQQEAARRIEQEHGPPRLASNRLELGRQEKEDSIRRFVLFRQAMELAADAGDGALTLEVLKEIEASFRPDGLPALKQEFYERFARNNPDSPGTELLGKTTDGQVLLGHAYWNLGGKDHGEAKEQMMIRAGEWYEQALPNLDPGNLKALVASRLKEICELKKYIASRKADREFAKRLEPAEQMVGRWDFAGAAAALDKLDLERVLENVDDDQQYRQYLGNRLEALRKTVEHLVILKGRVVKQIQNKTAAGEPYRKIDLGLTGAKPGNAIAAEENTITVKLDGSGDLEIHYWRKLDYHLAREGLLNVAIDPHNAFDNVAAALFALYAGDGPLAEKYLKNLPPASAQTGAYFVPFAARAFDQTGELLHRGQLLMEKKQFAEAKAQFESANSALDSVEEKYGTIPWFASNKAAFDAARADASTGIHEAGAEEVYAKAVQLFNLFNDTQDKTKLFYLRRVVKDLKASYARTRPMVNAQRKPSLAEMEQAVADLGKFITVRTDGKGDFTSIRAAIREAPPNSLIEIQDSNEYNERVVIPEEKHDLTIRGAKHFWPRVTCKKAVSSVVRVNAPETVLERLILVHLTPTGEAGELPSCVLIEAQGRARIRSTFLYMQGRTLALATAYTGHAHLEDCVVLGDVAPGTRPVSFVNCLFLSKKVAIRGPYPLRACTVIGTVHFSHANAEADDSIIGNIEIEKQGTRVSNCAFFGTSMPEGAVGSLVGDPMFVKPANLDYGLDEKSPCRGRASDGGDIGCRFTPEMLEMREVALDLRKKQIIKF